MLEEAFRVRRWFLVLAVLLVPWSRAEAWPIAPQTLWELTHLADLVVWAEIESAEPALSEESSNGGDGFSGALPMVSPGPGDVARLKVKEVWKGAVSEGERLEVPYDSGMLCPAPERYVKGLAVIAFLSRGTHGKWQTVGLSYGTRYPSSNGELDAYRRAVKQAQVASRQAAEAEAAGKQEEAYQARTDWRVLVASHPATRWDGLYGLAREADVYHSWYDDRVDLRSKPLTRAQRARLVRGFVEHPPLDRTLAMMLSALRGHASAEVDGVAANALETVFSGTQTPHWVGLAFNLLRERHGEKQVKWSMKEGGDPLMRGDADKGSLLRKEWKEFKQRHRLAPRRIAQLVEPPVSGTGGETPP